MKGLTGLVIAGILGVLGIVLNWYYLETRSNQLEMVSFLGIKDGVAIENGQAFREGDFVEVAVPKKHAEQLRDFVYLWEDRDSMLGVRATQEFGGGELLFRDDYRTPQRSLALRPNERLIPITVSERSPLLEPGDEISFWFPLGPGGDASGTTQQIGPFRLGAIGNQIGSREVNQAYRVPVMQGNLLQIVVRVEGDRFEQKAEALLERLSQSDGRQVKVIMHPRTDS